MTYASPLAYATREAPTRSFRSVEYDLLARATHRLKTAWLRRDQDFPALAAALDANQQLWSALAIDVADPGNELPASLRAQLFYLAEFTRKHSRRVLDDVASIEPLADINTAVMRGLRGEGGVA